MRQLNSSRLPNPYAQATTPSWVISISLPGSASQQRNIQRVIGILQLWNQIFSVLIDNNLDDNKTNDQRVHNLFPVSNFASRIFNCLKFLPFKGNSINDFYYGLKFDAELSFLLCITTKNYAFSYLEKKAPNCIQPICWIFGITFEQ